MSCVSSKSLREFARSTERYLIETAQKYGVETAYEIGVAIRDIGEEAKERVIAASPVKTGKYKRGWRVDFRNKDGVISCIVHQKKPTYRLTHLLEEGHKTRSGKSRAKARPHIRAVEEWAEEAVMQAIEKAVKG